MKVTQPDSRTVRILSDSGVAVLVPYRIFWNGHDRQAESVVLTAAEGRRPKEARGAYEVRAFFLFGEIRDKISSDSSVITLHRTWLMKTSGTMRLSIDVELDAPADLRCLFPGVFAAEGMPGAPVSFMGEKTSYPVSLFLSMGKNGVLLFSGTADCQGSAAGIGISRTEIEDEPPRLRVEARFPGVEEPSGRIGPGQEQFEEPAEAVIESPGALERSHEIFLAFSGREEIFLQGAAVAFSRLPLLPKKGAAEAPLSTELLAEALKAALSTHLLQKGGVVGMREVPGSPWLSATAGLGLAVAMRRLFPSDAGLQETALRLADFSLKGQLASGFFHESFHVGAGQWRGVRGQAKQTLLSLAQSSRIAELLFVLDEDLSRDGLPHEKYFLAGLRFVELFLDGKARLRMPGSLHLPSDLLPVSRIAPEARISQSPLTLGGLELFFPTARVRARTGRDRYKKALDILVRRFSAIPWDAFRPPGSRDGRGPDSAGALLAARLFIEMRAMGYKPAEPPASAAGAAKARAAESARLFASLLVPWIRVHPPAQGAGSAGTYTGCLVESFARQRLLFAGYQTALLLLRIGELTPASGGKSVLGGLARLCLASARAAPLGTAYVQHTRWDAEGKPDQGRGRIGPVDSRRLAEEILAGLRIAEEFPKI